MHRGTRSCLDWTLTALIDMFFGGVRARAVTDITWVAGSHDSMSEAEIVKEVRELRGSHRGSVDSIDNCTSDWLTHPQLSRVG